VKAYNPNVDPDRQAWLASDEESRIDLVVRYHRRQGIQGSAGRVHSIVHVVVENQLAMNESVVVDTLARLCREGLDRHSAIHAIGSVLAEEIYRLLKERAPCEGANGAYSERLKELTAADWKNAG
jgi:hypothetical protein